MPITHKKLTLDATTLISAGAQPDTVTLNPNGKGPVVKVPAISLRRACRAWLMNQEGYVIDEKNIIVASESDNDRTFYMLDTANACTIPVHRILMPSGKYAWRPTGGADKSYFLNPTGEGGTLAHSKHSLCILFHYMDVRIEVELNEKSREVLDYEILYAAADPAKRTQMEKDRVENALRAKLSNLFRAPVEVVED